MKKYNLFLDDIRTLDMAYRYTNFRPFMENEWEIVRSYDEFVKHIEKNGLPSFIAFDHDLSDEHYSPDMYKGKEVYDKHYDSFTEKTGYDCAKWLVDYCLDNNMRIPHFFVHSMNPVGGENIRSLLNQYIKIHNNG